MFKNTKITQMIKSLLISLTLFISITVQAQKKVEGAIVLELFTSQGCSSCPPADKLLDEVKEVYKGQNVFVMSYHVDYWNRLGWKDPFSAEPYSNYQREYADKFRSRSIYTPQLVINGSEHFVGSNSYKTNNAIKKYGNTKLSNTINFSNSENQNDSIDITYEVEGEEFDRLTFVLVVDERITKVGRGENRNRTLKNTNIVAERILTTEAKGAIKLKIPDWVQTEKDRLSVIAYVQNSNLKITGVSSKKI